MNPFYLLSINIWTRTTSHLQYWILILNGQQKDDGGGMDPEALRRCISFGFSDKKSEFTIGQCMDCTSFCSLNLLHDILSLLY